MSRRVQREQLKFAVVCARGLGDALLSMVLAHNLRLSGHMVTTFSSILCELKDWFPGFPILPYPTLEHLSTTLTPFDTVIAADHSLIKEHHSLDNQVVLLKESFFNKKRSMVENLQSVCAQKLSLPFSLPGNGIVPLKGLTYRAHPQRVLLHPTSSDAKKNWPAEKFIALAHILQNEGYHPYFCVSPAEAVYWKTYVPEEQLPMFPTVGALASFVYESGYLIGNDSGVGHLASALNIPTLTLFARKSYSRLWRPGWNGGRVVAPPNLLIGSRMKQKYWQKILSVKRVKKGFDKLMTN